MKKLLSMLLIGLLVLSGCGGNSESTQTESNKTDSETNENVDTQNEDTTNKEYSDKDFLSDEIFDNKTANSDDFSIFTGGESYAYIVDYMGSDEVLILPDTYNDLPVTKIDIYTFANSQPSKAVKFGKNLKTCEQAFIMNMAIKYVSINEGFEEIGYATFQNCENLERVDLPSTLKKIGEFAFTACESLKSLEIPSSVTFIDPGAFYNIGDDFELIVEKGSYAEEFAKENNIKFVIK